VSFDPASVGELWSRRHGSRANWAAASLVTDSSSN
jgi:hypothetical protein